MIDYKKGDTVYYIEKDKYIINKEKIIATYSDNTCCLESGRLFYMDTLKPLKELKKELINKLKKMILNAQKLK